MVSPFSNIILRNSYLNPQGREKIETSIINFHLFYIEHNWHSQATTYCIYKYLLHYTVQHIGQNKRELNLLYIMKIERKRFPRKINTKSVAPSISYDSVFIVFLSLNDLRYAGKCWRIYVYIPF